MTLSKFKMYPSLQKITEEKEWKAIRQLLTCSLEKDQDQDSYQWLLYRRRGKTLRSNQRRLGLYSAFLLPSIQLYKINRLNLHPKRTSMYTWLGIIIGHPQCWSGSKCGMYQDRKNVSGLIGSTSRVGKMITKSSVYIRSAQIHLSGFQQTSVDFSQILLASEIAHAIL